MKNLSLNLKMYIHQQNADKRNQSLLAKMEAEVDTLCLLAQPKEGQQQFKNKNNQN